MVLMSMTGIAGAQEHFTEGPVWECSAYRTLPGKWDDYMKYLRKNVAAIRAEAKEQGMVVDDRMFVQNPSDPTDWDVMFCTAFKNGSAALDYDAEMEKRWEAIAAKHLKTADDDEQRKMAEPRFEMRTFLGSNMMREVVLKPMD
jgi:hypothetical protein